MKATLLLGMLGATLAACGSVDAGASFGEVAANVHGRLGHDVQWIRDPEAEGLVARRVAELLARPLTADVAVQIALLNNRALQASFEELGLAQADLVQAGTLPNPLAGAAALIPTGGGGIPELDFDLAANLLGWLFRPARMQVATEFVEERKLALAHAVVELATATRVAFFEAVAAAEIAKLRAEFAEAAEVAADFADRLHAAGNLAELAVTLHRDAAQEARLEASRAAGDAVERREAATRLMGLWGDAAAWTMPERLPELPEREAPLDDAERWAIAHRFDLQAGLREIQAQAAALGLARASGIFGDRLEVGATAERDGEGRLSVGPSVAFELPLFGRGQSAMLGGEARLRSAEHRLTARAVEIRSEVRSLRDRLLLARERFEQATAIVLPLRKRAVTLTQELYDFMLAGTFELLEARRRLVAGQEAAVLSARDYWTLRAELTMVLGGSLPPQA